jgi:large repetitive protein
VTAGSLPPGLSLTPSSGSGGAITGSPTKAGTFNFTIKATDGGLTSTLAYEITITVAGPPDQLLCDPSDGSTLSQGMVGGAYAQNFFLSGGAGPYTWSLASGQLPPGLALQNFGDPRDADNELGGTPTTAGTYTFTYAAHRLPGQQATQQFSLTVDPALQISTAPLATGTVGVPYSHDLIAQGGAPPYSWSVVNNINP